MVLLKQLGISLLHVLWLLPENLLVLLLVLLLLEHFLRGEVLLVAYPSGVFLDDFVDSPVLARAHLNFDVVLLLECSGLAYVGQRSSRQEGQRLAPRKGRFGQCGHKRDFSGVGEDLA